MGHSHRLTGYLLVCVQVLAGWLAERNYRGLPELPDRPSGSRGHVTIVVPARNEANRLPELLHSLSRLRYPDYEVVVVDDGSTDDTASIASAHRVRVIRIDGPESGWVGKCFACWEGARATRGEWILFTDADTVHGPDSLGLAAGMAIDNDAALLSLLARQRCESFWERLLLPYAYALYFVGASRANRPDGEPVANGQYMLFRRRDYERIGGHFSVQASIIEDVALSRVAARSGMRVVLARGEDHLEVHMYDGLPGLWEGFAKNALSFVGVSPRTGIPTVLASIAFLAALPEAIRHRSSLMGLALLLTPVAALLPWQRRFGSPRGYALLYPLAAAVFQAIALDSIRSAAMGSGTRWKGRRY